MKHKGRHHRPKGGHRSKGPAMRAIGHEMTPDQEKADRMANRAANAGGGNPFAGGGEMAGPAPAGMGAGQGMGIGASSPPGQPMPPTGGGGMGPEELE